MCFSSEILSTLTKRYVTFPIESSVNGMPGVRRVRTSSRSVVGGHLTAETRWGAFPSRNLFYADRRAALWSQVQGQETGHIGMAGNLSGVIDVFRFGFNRVPSGFRDDVN